MGQGRAKKEGKNPSERPRTTKKEKKKWRKGVKRQWLKETGS